MNKEAIEHAIVFLNRTELKGSEVPYFNEIVSELEKEYNKKEEPIKENEESNEDIPEEDNDDINKDDDADKEPDIKDKEINKKKKKILDLMDEVNNL